MTQKEVIQKYFTVAIEGLRKQGWKQCESSLPGSTVKHCAWSNNQPGMHCAIGWIIPEKLHAEVRLTLQEASVAFNRRLYPEDLQKEMEEDRSVKVDYIKIWQYLHDTSSSPEQMESAFKQHAKERNLLWPEEIST